MRIVVFDTETIDLTKPFCYNIGYIIADTENNQILLERDFVCEQIWHNLELFSSAYYAEKKPLYVLSMRQHKTIMDKFGYICQTMIRDFKNYGVEKGFAYNSDFDERVFKFNCDWFKCSNPFDNIPIADIRGFFQKTLCGKDFKNFCEDYELFTESGNYSTTAETAYKFISKNDEFEEQHTALSDSLIEWEILKECLSVGAKITDNPKAVKIIPRIHEKTFKVKANGCTLLETDCISYKLYKNRDTVILQQI